MRFISLPLLSVCVAWLLFATGCTREVPTGTRWTMINVSPANGQADSHLLEFADGSVAMIDAADANDAPGGMLAYLREKKITRIALIVISHFHLDHYGRLEDIVRAGIRVDRVAINLPADRRLADRELPWGCDWEHVQYVLGLLREKNIPYFTPKAGEILHEVTVAGVRATLEAVCLFDGINTPLGETDINDTSILVRLTHGAKRALFTGDLNHALGAWLATSDFDLKADILKVPHHGTEGVAPNEFFAKVAPSVALVPAPRELWFSLRSKRVRDFFAERNIPAYVNGLHGHVVVDFSAEAFQIRPEKPYP